MKNSTFKLITYLINIGLGIAVVYFGFPFWSLLFLIPANLYLQIYAAQQYSFRNSIQLEGIPATGYEKRLAELNSNEILLADLGFERFDEFYLQTSVDCVGYAYTHRELPIILCQYHYEAGVFFDLMTDFDNDFSLTTANLKYSSVAELRSPQKFLQAFPEFPLAELFNKHIQSLRFLEQKGFVAFKKPIYNFRADFIKEIREAGERTKGFLSPVRLVYLMYFGNKARFTKTIQEQFLADQVRLP